MIRTEEEVDKLIEDMKKRTKGKYLTQGTSFNKECPRQMELLKKALMSSISFSGLVKEMLATNFNGAVSEIVINSNHIDNYKSKNKNVGNFI